MYELTKKWRDQLALSISLILFSTQLARLAMIFSSSEFLWLVVFGLVNGY
jgi:TctA family transporter